MLTRILPPQPPLARPRQCSFTESDWAVLSQHWFAVARADEIGDSPFKAKLLDVDLVIWRSPEGIAIARDLCVHRGTPLSLGQVRDGELICPYHGFRYAADGRCTFIPANPAVPIPAKLALRLFPAVERYGLIWTSLAGDQPQLPAFEAWEDADYQPIMAPVIDIAGSAGRQMEGFLDVAHFAFVHLETFGDPGNTVVPAYTVETTADGGLHVEYASTVSNFPKGFEHATPADYIWLRVFDVYPPFAARLVVHFPDGGQLWILNAPCPVSAKACRLFVPIARNFNTDGPVEDVHAFNLKVFNEDRAMVEAQTPEELPLDLREEIHIPADRTSLAYRRALKAMGLGEAYVS